VAPLRILISVRPYHGHFHSLVPLARALIDAGHEVAVATAPELASAVLAAGLAWYPAGLHPDAVLALGDDEDGADVEDEDYGPSVTAVKVADLVDIVLGSFAPDLVIRDPTDLAAVIAGELLGLRVATFGICHFINDLLWHLVDVDRQYNEARVQHGLAADPALDTLYDGLYLSIVPPELDMFDPLPVPRVQRIAYQPWDGGQGGVPPEWLAALPDRPTVLVTLGTVFNDRVDLFDGILGALEAEDVNVICTVGADFDVTALGRLPANARVEQYLPHSLVLPFCDVMVSHGGFNTVMGALCAGVPVVAIPLGSDQEHNAERCAELGIGIDIPEDDFDAGHLRRAVRRILADPEFKANLAVLSASMAAQPSPAAAVAAVEAEARTAVPA
jgi:UDP:flavonoid glycosyltransferase YjiC (YdhE family)